MAQSYYWEGVSDDGRTCGHRHRYFTRAVACCRSWERYMRRRYNRRETWIASRVTLVTRNTEGNDNDVT